MGLSTFHEFTLTTGELRLINLTQISTVGPLENENSNLSLNNGDLYAVRMSYEAVTDLLLPIYIVPKGSKL